MTYVKGVTPKPKTPKEVEDKIVEIYLSVNCVGYLAYPLYREAGITVERPIIRRILARAGVYKRVLGSSPAGNRTPRDEELRIIADFKETGKFHVVMQRAVKRGTNISIETIRRIIKRG